MRLGIVVGVCAALLLAGCSSGDGSAPDAAAPSSTPASATATTAPSPVSTAARSDCGRVELAQGETAVPEYACLLAASNAGRTARLVVVRRTVEGDPVTSAYTVRPGGLVEIREDNREDEFGSPRGVTLTVCPARDVLRDDPLTQRCSPTVPASAVAEPTETGPSGTS